MNLGFVVTTLGRLDPLRALLSSMEHQVAPGDHIVIVAQGQLAEITELVHEFHSRGVPVSVTESARGASRGRNAGVAALPPGDLVINFPNDTSTFPDGTVDRIRAAVEVPDFLVGGYSAWDERGPKTTLPEAGTPLDRWNMWSVIEMGILIRRAFFEELGGFDETIGPGASTPWQVAEGTDLLLRALGRRPEVAHRFLWLPSNVYVDGISTAFGLDGVERRRKLRAYGRGTGRVMAVHRYPLWWRAAFAAAGLFYGVRNPKPITIGDGWPMFVGRVEGELGRTFGNAKMVSTTR